MRVKVGRRYYDLQFTRIRGDAWGYCDPPDAPRKRILIHKPLGSKHRLEILIHEMLHALQWHIDEAHVAEAAKDMANVLDRVGYRAEK